MDFNESWDLMRLQVTGKIHDESLNTLLSSQNPAPLSHELVMVQIFAVMIVEYFYVIYIPRRKSYEKLSPGGRVPVVSLSDLNKNIFIRLIWNIS